MVTKKNDDNQIVGEQPSLIILKVDYETKLIIPIKDALEFIRIWSTAIEIKEAYGKDKKFQTVEKEFEIKFISGKKLKELQVAAMLNPKEEP